jgi:cysteine-rich repeat protein
MKDSFLEKIKIVAIGIFTILGLLAVNKAAMAQGCEFDDCSGSCFNTCFNENANRTDLVCCDKPCSPREYCDLFCACGDGQTGGCEQCDDGNNTSGDGCSADCQNEGPSVGMLAPFPVTYKKLPYVDLLSLEKIVAEDLNIDLTPGSPTMVAVKGFNNTSANNDLRASVIGTGAWLNILNHILFPNGSGSFDPWGGNGVTPIANYYGCTYTRAFTYPCVFADGTSGTCRSRGCRELPPGGTTGWSTTTSDNPMVCTVGMGCCSSASGCPLPGGGAIDGFY